MTGAISLQRIPDLISLAAFVGVVLLAPLYLSQRRDILRLRALREFDPDHPAKDFRASEALLDRAEVELEQVLVETGQFPAVAYREPATDPGQMTPLPPSERLDTGAMRAPSGYPTTSERPALEQLTMERDALLPHPRWRHFAARVTQPRVLAVVGLAAVAIGVGALFASGALLGGGNEAGAPPAKPGAISPGDITVSVLNGTSTPGLAGRVSDDVKASGFNLGNITNSRRPFQQTVVMFSPGEEKAANKVARVLGVTPVQPIDADTRAVAPQADVVVIAGADRAGP
jgi:LytR cell envelope-related transcriptional attenuator